MTTAYRVGAFLLASAILPCIASADEISPAQKKKALDLFMHGVEMVGRHESPEKLMDVFSRSYALDPQPGALLNLALAEGLSKQHHEVDAIKNLRFWLAIPNREPDDLAHANRMLERLLTKTGHIKLTGLAPTLVTVDGTDEATIRQVYDVLPGPHHVEVSNGRARKMLDTDIAANDTVEIALEPSPVLIAPTLAPVATQEPPPVVAEPKPIETVHEEHNGAFRIGVATGFGTAFATAVVVGAVLEANAKSNLNEASSLVASSADPAAACARSYSSSLCTSAQSHWQAHETDAHVAPWMFVSAGVFAVAGVASWKFLSPHDSKERTPEAPMSLVPTVAPTYIGATLLGHF